MARSARPLAIGKLRPGIVLYDEPHPLGDDIGTIETKDLNRKPDLLIIMGTSLKVHGLRKLVKEFASAVHAPTTSPRHASSKTHHKVIFVNKTAPSSEWNGIIDYHIQGPTDDWVHRVLEDWKKARPADWQIQTTLADTSMRVVKENASGSMKSKGNASSPCDKSVSDERSTVPPRHPRQEIENVDPSPSSSQASQKTLVDVFGDGDDDELPASKSVSMQRGTLARKSVSAPQVMFGGDKPAPLSPSKRANRTYTAAGSKPPIPFILQRQRSFSSTSTLTDLDEMECQSDAEAPMYDSESERSSPRKKRRSPTKDGDMSIDGLSFTINSSPPPPEQRILPQKLFLNAVRSAPSRTFTSLAQRRGK